MTLVACIKAQNNSLTDITKTAQRMATLGAQNNGGSLVQVERA